MKVCAFAGYLLAVISSVHAQTIKEDIAALDSPDGKVSTFSVKAGTPIKALRRQGFWVQIEAGGKTAWVKASALNFSAGPGGPIAVDTGRLGRGNIVATSAARGLSAKDILNGTPRLDDVRRLAEFAVDAAAVQGFVAQGSMQPPARAVALVAPAAATHGAAGAGRTATAQAGTATPSPGSVARRKDSDEW